MPKAPHLRPIARLAVTLACFVPVSATFLQAAPTPTGMRSVFMNGTDISSARSQDLKNVDIHINENGDIFIVGPQYQVNEEDTYVPLSKFVQGMNAPAHRQPQAVNQAINVEVTSPKAVPIAPAPSGDTAMLPKAGQSEPPPEGAAKGEDTPPPALPDDEPKAEGTK